MRRQRLEIPKDRLAELCQRHRIRKLSLFGSVLRDDFRPDSDVAVLIQFEAGHVVGFNIMDVEEELSQLLAGHKIGLVNEKYLNRRLRARILAEAEVRYEQG